MDSTLSKFKALSDRNRLRVVAVLLDQEELCACQIIELLNVTGATASRHMTALVSSGLVESRKEGRWVHYRINRDNEGVAPMLEWLRREFKGDEAIGLDREFITKILSCDPEELCRRQRGALCRS